MLHKRNTRKSIVHLLVITQTMGIPTQNLRGDAALMPVAKLCRCLGVRVISLITLELTSLVAIADIQMMLSVKYQVWTTFVHYLKCFLKY